MDFQGVQVNVPIIAQGHDFPAAQAGIEHDHGGIIKTVILAMCCDEHALLVGQGAVGALGALWNGQLVAGIKEDQPILAGGLKERAGGHG